MDIFDLVFPRNCLNCGKENGYIGSRCLSQVSKAISICPVCEKPSIDGATHSKCQTRLGIDGLTSVWVYEGVIRKAIVALKYKYATEIATDLATVSLSSLGHNASFWRHDSYTLVPIPMHWYRQNFRGFNQSQEIGKKVAKEMDWKFLPDLLIRKKLGTPQAGLDAQKRSKNIQGVFALNPSYSSTNLTIYPPIFLFDDVWTTGSTMKEAAKVLKRVGVLKVWGLTVAR